MTLNICTGDFNPHSREGSDRHMWTGSHHKTNFNPHSREGSDHIKQNWAFDCGISIHTPAKGVTALVEMETNVSNISIHTPAKGVTESALYCNGIFRISIHTPAKGVTCCKRPERLYIQNFNPHSREGSDIVDAVDIFEEEVFQSTLPRRE